MNLTIEERLARCARDLVLGQLRSEDAQWLIEQNYLFLGFFRGMEELLSPREEESNVLVLPMRLRI